MKHMRKIWVAKACVLWIVYAFIGFLAFSLCASYGLGALLDAFALVFCANVLVSLAVAKFFDLFNANSYQEA